MKFYKKIMSGIMALSMLAVSVPEQGIMSNITDTIHISASETADPETTLSGKCGTDVTWKYDKETKTMTFTGKGKIDDYYSEKQLRWEEFCGDVTTVVIEDGITDIGDYTFEEFTNMTLISIPDSVTLIGKYAFISCTSLKSIALPKNLINISKNTFSGCTSLEKISIPDYLSEIGEYAFYECTNLNEINIPDSVMLIGTSSFGKCSSLKSIELSSNILWIPSSLFSECTNLEEVRITSPIHTICNNAFLGCSKLSSIYIPHSVQSIEMYAFKDCTALTSLSLPKSVSTVESSAFENCKNLTCVTIWNPELIFNDVVFNGCSINEIYGMKNSTGEKYAKDNSITFNAIDEIVSDEKYTTDVDGNGITNSIDIALLQTYIISQTTSKTDKNNYDINKDGEVTASDMLYMQYITLG